MKYLSCADIRELDTKAVEEYGIPSIVLMENASLRFFDELKHFLKNIKNKKAVVICGSGNNGGDGFAIARHLKNEGASPVILFTGLVDKLSPSSDAGINAIAARNMNIPIIESILSDKRKYSTRIKKADMVIDAVFGTGLTRNIEGSYTRLIEAISTGEKIISVDIPSGLNGDTGLPMGIAVKADLTVTFAAAKTGFRKKCSKEYTGIVKVVSISIPSFLIK